MRSTADGWYAPAAAAALPSGVGRLSQQPVMVSRAFSSWNRSILTEIYLCHACAYHEIEDGNARAGGGAVPGSARHDPARATEQEEEEEEEEEKEATAAARSQRQQGEAAPERQCVHCRAEPVYGGDKTAQLCKSCLRLAERVVVSETAAPCCSTDSQARPAQLTITPRAYLFAQCVWCLRDYHKLPKPDTALQAEQSATAPETTDAGATHTVLCERALIKLRVRKPDGTTARVECERDCTVSALTALVAAAAGWDTTAHADGTTLLLSLDNTKPLDAYLILRLLSPCLLPPIGACFHLTAPPACVIEATRLCARRC
jgi:hypothetical protein